MILTGILQVDEEPPPLESLNGRSGYGFGGGNKMKAKSAARFIVFNNFVNFTLAELNRGEIAVWLILFRDSKDGIAKTSISDLARGAGCARRSVLRAIKSLEKKNLFKVVHRGGLGQGTSRYRVFSFPGGGTG